MVFNLHNQIMFYICTTSHIPRNITKDVTLYLNVDSWIDKIEFKLTKSKLLKNKLVKKIIYLTNNMDDLIESEEREYDELNNEIDQYKCEFLMYLKKYYAILRTDPEEFALIDNIILPFLLL